MIYLKNLYNLGRNKYIYITFLVVFKNYIL